MEILVVSIVAFMASALTLFTGFGLGTLLMPAVAIFFPVEIAISVTAMVHLANNLFKAALLGRYADRKVLFQFGTPAIIFSFVGAATLVWLADLPPAFAYVAFSRQIQVSPVNLTVGILILSIVILELSPKFARVTLDKSYLPFGGVVSGFFGGLSGHQGAFRSMFLLKTGLDKDQFIATGIMAAVLVDMSRIYIYGWDIFTHQQEIEWPLILTASLSALVGTHLSAKKFKKITIQTVRTIVSALLIVISLGLISGLL